MFAAVEAARERSLGQRRGGGGWWREEKKGTRGRIGSEELFTSDCLTVVGLAAWKEGAPNSR